MQFSRLRHRRYSLLYRKALQVGVFVGGSRRSRFEEGLQVPEGVGKLGASDHVLLVRASSTFSWRVTGQVAS